MNDRVPQIKGDRFNHRQVLSRAEPSAGKWARNCASLPGQRKLDIRLEWNGVVLLNSPSSSQNGRAHMIFNALTIAGSDSRCGRRYTGGPKNIWRSGSLRNFGRYRGNGSEHS